MAPNDSLNYPRDRLEAMNVGVAEIVQSVAVHVDYACYPTVRIEEGNNYLGTSRRTARDMARKFLHVRDDDRVTRRVGMATNAFVKIDPRARQRTLKRAEYQLVSFTQIKPDPEETESLLKDSGNVC